MILLRKEHRIPAPVLIGIGNGCLVVAVLLGRYGNTLPGTDFIQGLLLGLSITLNLTGLWLWRSQRRQTD
jgi:hypothetical protein